MKSPLENVVAFIKDKGLPSKEQMRAELEQNGITFQNALREKVSEYDGLFGRFKAGEELTNSERERMADLSGEFERLSSN